MSADRIRKFDNFTSMPPEQHFYPAALAFGKYFKLWQSLVLYFFLVQYFQCITTTRIYHVCFLYKTSSF